MKSKLFLSCAAVLLVSLLAGTNLCAQSDQPSLADVARQKSGVKARRVVTNDQIPPSAEANNPPASPRNGAGSADKPATPAAGKDAASKSQAPPDPQTRMQKLNAENTDLIRVIAKLQEKIESSDDHSAITALSEAVQHAKSALAANQAEIDKLNASGPAANQTTETAPAQQHSTK
jgi:hypothetical protein